MSHKQNDKYIELIKELEEEVEQYTTDLDNAENDLLESIRWFKSRSKVLFETQHRLSTLKKNHE